MGYIYAENFDCIGRVDADGRIYNAKLDYVGRIESDGRIYNTMYEYIARIESDGYIYLSNYKRVGRVESDGYVYDESFNRVGRLDQDIVNRILKKNSSSGSVSAGASGNGTSSGGGIPSVQPSTGGMGCGGMIVIALIALFWIYLVIAILPGMTMAILNSVWIFVYIVAAVFLGMLRMNKIESFDKEILVLGIENYIVCMVSWLFMCLEEKGSSTLDVLGGTAVVAGTMVFFALIMAGISYMFKQMALYFKKSGHLTPFVTVCCIFVAVITFYYLYDYSDKVNDTYDSLNQQVMTEDDYYNKGNEYYQDRKLVDAMKCFLEIPDYKDSNTLLIEVAKSYLNKYWEDDERPKQGFIRINEKLFVWKYRIKELFGSEEYDWTYNYPILDYFVFWKDGEVCISIDVDNEGSVGHFTFYDLTDTTFYCENNGSFTVSDY